MQGTYLPARKVEIAFAWLGTSSLGIEWAKRSQKYWRSGSVRTLFMNRFRGINGFSSLCRVIIAFNFLTLQMSVPTRKEKGKGRGGIEDRGERGVEGNAYCFPNTSLGRIYYTSHA